MKYLLVVGAKSDMARALVRKYAAAGYAVYLTGRGDISELYAFAADLRIRYKIDVKTMVLDLNDFHNHEKFYNNLEPKPEGVLCAAGYLGDQEKAQNRIDETMTTIISNYSGCVSMLNVVANHFENRKSGFIIGISSVAGDRGRKSNYIYGSAKAGFTAYLSGLRNRLAASGVSVLTVKPGFVYTRMTEGLDLPPLLTARPEQVADVVFNAWKKGRDIVYVKGLWRFIMLIIRIIPERIFKKMSI